MTNVRGLACGWDMVQVAKWSPKHAGTFLQRGSTVSDPRHLPEGQAAPITVRAPRSQEEAGDGACRLMACGGETEFILFVPNLHRRKLKHREVGDLLQVTQP